MGKCPDDILRLIKRFDEQSDQVRSSDFNKTTLHIDFINPMFRLLGWAINNSRLARAFRAAGVLARR